MARALALILLLAAGACQRPRAYVICHNSNCASSDPDADDTLPALERSLALRWNGRPLIDGIEVDTVWDGSAERCAFAHDADAAASAPDGRTAAQLVAEHLRLTASVAGDRPFFVKLDIKDYAGPDGTALSEPQAEGQIACALDMYAIVRNAAVEAQRYVTVLFNADDPALLQRLVDHARYPGQQDGERVRTGLMLPSSTRLPDGTRPDVVSIAASEVHAKEAATLAELRSRGIEVMLWMLDADPAVLDAVAEVEPEYVATNEAAVLREWLGPAP